MGDLQVTRPFRAGSARGAMFMCGSTAAAPHSILLSCLLFMLNKVWLPVISLGVGQTKKEVGHRVAELARKKVQPNPAPTSRGMMQTGSNARPQNIFTQFERHRMLLPLVVLLDQKSGIQPPSRRHGSEHPESLRRLVPTPVGAVAHSRRGWSFAWGMMRCASMNTIKPPACRWVFIRCGA